MTSIVARLRGILALAVGFLLLALGTVSAHDQLAETVARLPNDLAAATDGILFEYVSPHISQNWEPDRRPAIGDYGLLEVFRQPEQAGALTGVDFTAINAIAFSSTPLTTFIYLSGSGIDPQAVSDALLPRGFTRVDIPQMTAFERGIDGEYDLQLREAGDPFGGGIGRSQRVGVVDHRLLVTSSSSAFQLFGPMLNQNAETTALGSVLRSMALAAEKVVGGTVYAAYGFTPEMFADSTMLNLQNLDIEIGSSEIFYPPFELALMIGSINDQAESAQVILSFDNSANAAAAIDEVGARLAAFMVDRRPPGALVETTVSECEDGAIGIVSLTFEKSDDRPSFRELNLWLVATQQRAFTVLDPAYR